MQSPPQTRHSSNRSRRPDASARIGASESSRIGSIVPVMIRESLVLACWLIPAVAGAQVPKAIFVDPMAIPPGKSSVLNIRGTGLKDSTSLWTNLNARVTRVDGHEPEASLASVLEGAETRPENAIILEAEEYNRGTWGRRPPFILNIGGGNTNVAEWDVELEAAGNFILELNYASGGERPVALSVNGTRITDDAARTQTGGFGTDDGRWIPQCVLTLRAGINTIRMERTGGTPHFDKLALIPTDQAATTAVSVAPSDRVAPYRLKVPRETAVGIRGLRIATASGLSNMLLFMVDDLQTVKELPAQSASKDGHRLKLPVAVEGHCDSTHADRFAFTAVAGEELSFEAVACRLGTSLDPILRLMDAHGRELAFADDTPGLSGDCSIRHRFTESGTYFVTIEDALAGGSSSYRYRLRIGDFPIITAPIPGAVQSGETTNIRFAGYAVSDNSRAVQPTPTGSPVPLSLQFEGKEGSGFSQVQVSPHPQYVFEPSRVGTISIPAGVSGVFTSANERHVWSIDVKRGQKLEITDLSRSRGVPAMVAISVHDTAGKLLASVRKAGPSGSSLTWTAPKDGRYEIRLAELVGRAGPEFGYHVSIEEQRPDFALAVEKDSSILPQNGYAILKVTAQRRGFNGPIRLAVSGLGESVELGNAIIEEKSNSTRLKVYSPSGLSPGQTQAIEITGIATVDDNPVVRYASTTAAIRKALPRATYPPVGLDRMVALSIGPEIPDFFDLALDGGEILFPRLVGEVYFTVRVKDRDKGFKDPVSISVVGLPPGFSASGGDRPVSRSENNEYRFQLRGPSAIVTSVGLVQIVGEASFKGQTKEVTLAKVPFRVIEPLLITATCDTRLTQGSKGRLKLQARRFVPRAGGDKAPIHITFESLPPGVRLPESITIPAGQDQATVEYSIADNANVTSPPRVKATTVVAGQTVSVATSVEEPSP